MCPRAHEHMPMEANNPTKSNDYATPTNPCHVCTTENRSGQVATNRKQIRADRDNPPLSLRALSSSLTSTCKSRCLHPNLRYTRLNLHGGSKFTELLKVIRAMLHWTPVASWSSTFTEPVKPIQRCRDHTPACGIPCQLAFHQHAPQYACHHTENYRIHGIAPCSQGYSRACRAS